MKKFLVGILLVIAIVNIFGQKTYHIIYGDTACMNCVEKYFFGLTCYPKRSLPDGKYYFYYDSNKTNICSIINYKNNKREGYAISYDKDGCLQSITELKNGEADGEFRLYDCRLIHKFREYKGEIIDNAYYYDTLGRILEKKTYPVPSEKERRLIFIPDTVINEGIIITDYIKGNTNTFTFYVTKNNKQYLNIYRDAENANIIYFEIGLNSSIENKKVVNADNFISNSGLRLGLSFNEVLQIKGTDFYSIEDNYIKYLYTGNESYYNPYYKMECFFQSNKMNKIKITIDLLNVSN
ncbi:MAG TPA: hypothetical protein PLP76_05870 [Bacteroidales bacterium]|mgnify:FL=1|nr:hypothetical protein [Bacteroidales bacterium]HPJ91049.1 hypothetical protein [Bacteroidales bacterium]